MASSMLDIAALEAAQPQGPYPTIYHRATEEDALLQDPLREIPSSNPHTTSKGTILYLAYGSNLSSETFRGRRGIKPLSALNVHVPSLDLTFDLAGIPYMEPCFANTQYHDPSPPPKHTPYHKVLWRKGLIGVVYEVTLDDYRTIIATEGGGASYQDVVVDCFPLAKGAKVVDEIRPGDVAFKAHTLLCPRIPSGKAKAQRIERPDPNYAQASARYMKLLTDGAEEHALPAEYIDYLYNVRSYTITTYRQRLGQIAFIAAWSPWLFLVLGLGRVFAGKDGRVPKWLIRITDFVFRVMWGSYDRVFKNVFGDGERTVEDEGKSGDVETGRRKRWCEKFSRRS